ncbi:MAG: flagellar basal body-associated FliL family protein [Methylomonas sp.]|nr:flagellar basal body-associated FliL family protein [Methylomonas sp.]
MAEAIEGEKKSSKKLWIIIALVVLLGGGAAAAYFLLMKPPAEAGADPHGDKAAEASEHAAPEAAAHEDEAEGHETEEYVYYPLPTPLIVNFPAGASAKLVKISLTVQVKGEAGVEALKKHEPMIRNNLLMAISSIGADKAKTLEGKKELQALMLSEIGKVLERMTKKNSAKDVFFTEFVMQ